MRQRRYDQNALTHCSRKMGAKIWYLRSCGQERKKQGSAGTHCIQAGTRPLLTAVKTHHPLGEPGVSVQVR